MCVANIHFSSAVTTRFRTISCWLRMGSEEKTLSIRMLCLNWRIRVTSTFQAFKPYLLSSNVTEKQFISVPLTPLWTPVLSAWTTFLNVSVLIFSKSTPTSSFESYFYLSGSLRPAALSEFHFYNFNSFFIWMFRIFISLNLLEWKVLANQMSQYWIMNIFLFKRKQI